MSQHWILLLRPGQFIKQAPHVATLFIYHNQRFFFLQRRDIHHLVATDTSSFSVTTYITLSQQILLLSVSQHTLPCHDKGLSLKLFLCLNKLFHVAIINVMTEDPLLQQNICFLPVSFVMTRASLSRQILPGVDTLLKNLVAT